MDARLSWGFREGEPVVLKDVLRYAGCMSGSLDGKTVARPVADFSHLSLDGIRWEPLRDLLHLVQWENPEDVPGTELPVQG